MGGAIYVDAKNGTSLTIENDSFTGNYSKHGNWRSGGAIYVDGEGGQSPYSVSISNSNFSNNIGQVNGGAIMFIGSGDVLIVDCEFVNNTVKQHRGGAIYPAVESESDGKLTISIDHSIFKDNSAYYDGGAVDVEPHVHLTVTNSEFENNSAGRDAGAIGTWSGMTDYTIDISNSTFTNNRASWGGAILTANATTTLNNVKFANNSANTGGGVCNIGEFTATNVIFEGNTANGDGGGIWSSRTLTLTNALFTGNTKGGLTNSGTLQLVNSVVIGSTSAGLTNAGTAMIVNSTISGNEGYGVSTTGALEIYNSIVLENYQGEILVSGKGTVVGANNLSSYGANIDGFLVEGSERLPSASAVFTTAPQFDEEGKLTNRNAVDLFRV